MVKEMSEDKKVWGIHTMDDNLFLHNDIIGIGWSDMGDLKKIGASRDAIKAKYTEVYPDSKKGSVANGAGMLYRFVYEMQVGDYIVFPSKIDR
jgi:restriction system protein